MLRRYGYSIGMVFVAIMVLSGAPSTRGEDPTAVADSVKIISEIQSVSRRNFSAIHTWQGVMSIKELQYLRGERRDFFLDGTRVDPKRYAAGVLCELNLKVDFACDFDRGVLFFESRQTVPKVTDLSDGSPIKIRGLGGANFIQVITPSEYMYLNTSMRDTEEPVRVARVVPLEKMRGEPAFHDFFDPRKVFLPNQQQPLWECFGSFAAQPERVVKALATQPATLEWKCDLVGTKPDRFRMTASVVDQGKKFHREITCDSGAAMNWTRIVESRNSRKKYQAEASYEQVFGVSLPKRHTFIMWTDEGQPEVERSILFNVNTPNAWIPDHRFTVDALGLKDGEKVQDDIRKTRSVYRAKRLVTNSAPALK